MLVLSSQLVGVGVCVGRCSVNKVSHSPERQTEGSSILLLCRGKRQDQGTNPQLRVAGLKRFGQLKIGGDFSSTSKLSRMLKRFRLISGGRCQPKTFKTNIDVLLNPVLWVGQSAVASDCRAEHDPITRLSKSGESTGRTF